MKKAIVKRMYRAFDHLYATKELAETVITGWEHKERITEVWAVGYPSDLEQDEVELTNLYITRSLSDANEERDEMNA